MTAQSCNITSLGGRGRRITLSLRSSSIVSYRLARVGGGGGIEREEYLETEKGGVAGRKNLLHL